MLLNKKIFGLITISLFFMSCSLYSANKLTDSRVLPVLVDETDYVKTVFAGTDGGGLQWGQASIDDLLPSNWSSIDTSNTPGIYSNHFRFLFMTTFPSGKKILYAATYKGLSYASFNPVSGFSKWTTSMVDSTNILTQRCRSIYVTIDSVSGNHSLYLATDGGLWRASIDSSGAPQDWSSLGLNQFSISSIYVSQNNSTTILIAGTSKSGIAIAQSVTSSTPNWQFITTKEGISSNFIWDTYITGAKTGNILALGTNRGGFNWTSIQSVSTDSLTLSPWHYVNTKTQGFLDNSNAQIILTKDLDLYTAWVATRKGLSISTSDTNKFFSTWEGYTIPKTTNDLGSIVVQNNIIYVGIYNTGLAASYLSSTKKPNKWHVIRSKKK